MIILDKNVWFWRVFILIEERINVKYVIKNVIVFVKEACIDFLERERREGFIKKKIFVFSCEGGG